MKSVLRFCTIAAALLAATSWGNDAKQNEESDIPYHAFVLPVVYHDADEAACKAAADRLAQALYGFKAGPVKVNGACGFYFEREDLRDWNASQEGFTVLLQRGGAVARVTSASQAEAAVDAVLKVMRKSADGKALLPLNLVITNYPVKVVVSEAGKTPQTASPLRSNGRADSQSTH